MPPRAAPPPACLGLGLGLGLGIGLGLGLGEALGLGVALGLRVALGLGVAEGLGVAKGELYALLSPCRVDDRAVQPPLCRQRGYLVRFHVGPLRRP